MTQYRYLAVDWLSKKVKAELPLSDIHYGHILDRSGGFSGTIPKQHPKATRDNLDTNRTFLFVERGGVLVWGGILWTCQIQSNTLQLGGEGFFSYYMGRKIRSTATFTNTEQLAIPQSLLATAHAQQYGDIGITVPVPVASGITRDRTYYGYERKVLGEVIIQLAEVINGFDFAIDPYWNGNDIVMPFTMHYPMRGRNPTNLLFEYRGNMVGYTLYEDGKKQSNVNDALGAGENDSMLIATSTSLTGAYPRLEDDFSYRDVSVSSTLQGKADAEGRNRSLPVQTLGIKVINTQAASIGDWITGDVVRIKINDYWTQIDAYYRIMEWKVDVSEENAEEISFVLSLASTTTP